jgi:arginyl-tRNA synthetase
MNDIKTILSERFAVAIQAVYGNEHGDIDPLINVASHTGFGDYQANLAMSLAKKQGEKPRDIAAAIVAKLDLENICEKIEIAGPGFINLHLDEAFINDKISALAEDPGLGVKPAALAQTVVIDYSAPNVAKEMHVGHLRSTVIGDAMARVLMVQGHEVIRQNHMGDWGTQFGMLIEYLVDNGWDKKSVDKSISDLNILYQESKLKFDSDNDFNERARTRVVDLQGGDEYTLQIWRYLVKESIDHFNEIYHRLGVLLEETDNCPESFYNPRLRGIVESLSDSKMLEVSEGAAVIFLDGFKDREDKPLPMIVRKSDGGYLYATTDLAAVRYRVEELKANRIIYITDSRQSQHFAMLFAAVRKAGWVGEDVRLDHMPFGSVLGANRKPFKTRDGGTIKLSDLLDEATSRVSVVIQNKNPDLNEDERAELARVISLAALKYADLSNDRIKDYVFDWDRMLALDGNTAPYLLNAYVRVVSIFRKGNIDRQSINRQNLFIKVPAERMLASKLYQYAEAVEAVSDRLEPHRLCTYLYELASCLHAFYESCPILKDGVTQEERGSRLVLSDLCARVMHHGLGLLGIDTVEQM